MTTALARRPAASLVAEASGERLPTYVTREQARAIINAASSQTHRLLLECLLQSGGHSSRSRRSALGSAHGTRKLDVARVAAGAHSPLDAKQQRPGRSVGLIHLALGQFLFMC